MPATTKKETRLGSYAGDNMPRKPKKELICNVHERIKDTAVDIRDILKKVKGIGKRDMQRLDRRIDSIIEDTCKALSSGQSMENRMSEYRDAIERLGFTRD
jgi:SMC interacting uncharacterized protein involved in chromosome segregation